MCTYFFRGGLASGLPAKRLLSLLSLKSCSCIVLVPFMTSSCIFIVLLNWCSFNPLLAHWI